MSDLAGIVSALAALGALAGVAVGAFGEYELVAVAMAFAFGWLAGMAFCGRMPTGKHRE